MKKTLLTYIIILTCLITKGQNNVYIDKPYFGLPERGAEIKEIDSLNQIPNRIKFIVQQLIDSSMTDFVNNMFFIKGQIIDLQKFYLKDSISQSNSKFIMPKYELYFELRDTLINIKSYCIEIDLDQYGQITSFQWPREGYNKRKDFIKGNVLKKTAKTYANNKLYKTKTCIYDLKFNESKQTLEWNFSFLQESTGNEISHLEKYKTISINIKSKTNISEYDTESYSISCGSN